MNRITTFVAGLVACMMFGQTAQAQMKLQSKNADQQQTTLPSLKAMNSKGYAMNRLTAPVKASSSVKSTLIDEDFQGITWGSEEKPDTVNYLASQWFGDHNTVIDPSLTKDGTWVGDWVMAAGGKVYMRTYNFQSPCMLCTPVGDYSGKLTITGRFKPVKYAVPHDRDEDGNWTDWHYYSGSTLNIMLLKGSLENPSYCNTDDPAGMVSFRAYPQEGWQEFVYEVENYDADNSSFIAFTTSDGLLLDDIKVVASYENGIAQPNIIGVTDYQHDNFTIAWEPVRHSYNYYLDLWKKVYTSDSEQQFAEDFENYSGAQEGWEISSTEVSEEEGLNGTKGLILRNDDVITLPKTDGTYKKGEMYVHLVDPSVDQNNPWWAFNLQGDLNVEALDAEGNWITIGTISGYQAADWAILALQELKDCANNYYSFRLSVNNLSETGYFVIDDVDIVGNRAFELERVTGPKGKNYGEYDENGNQQNYTFYENTQKCEFTFTNLEPETEYYYGVRSHNVHQFSTRVRLHALGLGAPVATMATDIDSRGTFTANWEASPKAMKYYVNLYGIQQAKSNTQNMTLLEEDFEKIEGAETTNPDEAESLGNTFEVQSYDDYTSQPGWTGNGNSIANGMLGCDPAMYMYTYITTPVIDCSNSDKIYVTLRAYSYPGEQLLFTIDGVQYAIAFDENGAIDVEFEMPVENDQQQLQFMTYQYSPWLLDYLRIGQDVKAGGVVKTQLQQGETEELSYQFSNLSDTDYEKFAYDVQASYEHEGSWATSVKSNLIIVDLENESSEPYGNVVTGINSVNNHMGTDAQFWTIDGRRAAAGQKGLVIMRQADGTMRKVMVK